MNWSSSWQEDNDKGVYQGIELTLLDVQDRECKVVGSIVGSLAVHPDQDYPVYFKITHIPTLATIMQACPVKKGVKYTEKQLLDWCRKVQSNLHNDWEYINKLTPDNYYDNDWKQREVKERLKRWCLSVEIE